MEHETVSNTLCELICTRICHDLVGAVGAISNGVEFLDDEDPAFFEQGKKLMANSAATLTARLRFFRIVFGAGGASLAKPDHVNDVAQDYINHSGGRPGNISLQWNPLGKGILSQSDEILIHRIALLFAMLAADCLVEGGEVVVSFSALASHVSLNVYAKGGKVRLNDDVKLIFERAQHTNSPETLLSLAVPRSAPALAALELARQWGNAPTCEEGDSEVIFGINS